MSQEGDTCPNLPRCKVLQCSSKQRYNNSELEPVREMFDGAGAVAEKLDIEELEKEGWEVVKDVKEDNADDIKEVKAIDQSSEERYLKSDEEIGKGSFKTVFRGLNRETGVAVAWCQIRQNKLSEDERNLFHEEAKLLKGLEHPNLVRFYDCWDVVQQSKMAAANPNKYTVIVTELMTSGTMKTYLKRFRTLNARILKSWCRQVLKGLLFLHTRKPPVIHGDLKCDNIFITGPTGSIKIGDLGLATLKNIFYGESYAKFNAESTAPEMYDDKQYDMATDVYSFGLCMLEMATGEYPYSECSGPAEIYRKVVNNVKPKSLEKVENKEVKEIIEQCIRLKMEERPSIKKLLAKDFFAEDTGFKLDMCEREELVKSDSSAVIFRLSVMDTKKFKKDEPAHKENEAIEFEFTIGVDNTAEFTQNMVESGLLPKEDDSKKVAKMMETQIKQLATERCERLAKPDTEVETVEDKDKRHWRLN